MSYFNSPISHLSNNSYDIFGNELTTMLQFLSLNSERETREGNTNYTGIDTCLKENENPQVQEQSQDSIVETFRSLNQRSPLTNIHLAQGKKKKSKVQKKQKIQFESQYSSSSKQNSILLSLR